MTLVAHTGNNRHRSRWCCSVWLACALLQLFAGFTARADPILLSVEIEPDGWSGFGLYESQEFTCVPQWDDAIPDPDCTRAGAPPDWTAAGYGSIVGPSNLSA